MTDVLTEMMRLLYRPSTVLCRPEQEAALRAELARRRMDAIVTLYPSSRVPDGKLLVIDNAALGPE